MLRADRRVEASGSVKARLLPGLFLDLKECAKMSTSISGVWLPIVTPFKDGEVDVKSYERLLRHYLDTGINGVISLGTTGESPTIEDDEAEALVELTLD